MAKVTLTTITGGFASIAELNANFTALATALENTVSRDGTTPNSMNADLDLNSNDILNGNVGAFQSVTIGGVSVVPGSTLSVPGASSVPFTPAGGIAANEVQSAIEELDAEKQPLDAELTALAGLTSAANKIPYFTGSGTAGMFDFKDEDNMVSDSATALPSQQSVKAYIDTQIAAQTKTFVTAADGGPYISSTNFDIDANLTASTWESIGPTGSGATNIWTALDSVPAGVDWIELKIIMDARSTGDTASVQRVIRLNGRKNGGSVTSLTTTLLARQQTYLDSSGFGSVDSITIVKVPVDSSVIFEALWANSYNNLWHIDIYLTGCGYN